MKIQHILVCFVLCLSGIFGYATVVKPGIFSNNMVLQRNSEVTLWGWGDINEKVTLTTSWDGATYEMNTPLTTKWEFKINTPGAGGPYVITLTGRSNEIVLENIMLGEVWLASGQSNMEWSANDGIDNADAEINAANYPDIRFFTVTKRTSANKQDDLTGSWLACTPESMRYFSAVGYFFARKLQGELNVPIGIIDTGWGATCAEVWTPSTVFEEHADLRVAAEKVSKNVWAPTQPSILFNAMIYPIAQFKIAGALWYQGESNTANSESYQKLFTAMITSWRKAWGYDFPFYFAQIAPFNYGTAQTGAMVRDQQRRALNLKGTGMVVVSDICTVDDIHPRNKQDVGLRMANLALSDHYGLDKGTVNGPLFKDFKVEGKHVNLVFDHGQGLYFKGKSLELFELAGADGIFYPAKANLKKGQVVLWAKEVPTPAHVRYAWSNTALANLFNGAGLPASSFTTE